MWGFVPICQMASIQLLVGQNCLNTPVCTPKKAKEAFFEIIILNLEIIPKKKKNKFFDLVLVLAFVFNFLDVFSDRAAVTEVARIEAAGSMREERGNRRENTAN